MRTFLSQEATARCSETGEKETSDMLSSGGSLSGTSFDMSPCVGLLGVLDAGVEPKSDILRSEEIANQASRRATSPLF